MLPVLEAQLREVQASIDNMIKAIEMGIITASTKERLEALEDDKKKLLSAIATEKMEHPDIPKEFFGTGILHRFITSVWTIWLYLT